MVIDFLFTGCFFFTSNICFNIFDIYTTLSHIDLLTLVFFSLPSFSGQTSSLIRVRFLLGGRHGDFKFLPPSSYAPCYEALLPKEKMKVEPVKEYKRDVEGVRDLLGTTQFTSQASFIPTPVETSQVSSPEECEVVIHTTKISMIFVLLQIVMPPHLEKVRDRLAENIHELWGMNKIELGWTYGKVRKRLTVSFLLQQDHHLGGKIKKPNPYILPCLWRNKDHDYTFSQ